jgi:hypothetical protein
LVRQGIGDASAAGEGEAEAMEGPHYGDGAGTVPSMLEIDHVVPSQVSAAWAANRGAVRGASGEAVGKHARMLAELMFVVQARTATWGRRGS